MSEANIVCHSSADGSSATITLAGDVTIESTGELHRVLRECLEGHQRVALNVRDLNSIDLPVLQLLCSACRTAAERQRILVSETELPECMLSAGRSLGGSPGVPCSQNSNDPCSWFGGVR